MIWLRGSKTKVIGVLCLTEKSAKRFHRVPKLPSFTRQGFTLIETVLALGLSSVLLLAVFGLVNSTVTYHITGNHQVLASQRMLGVLHDLRYDLQAVESDPAWFAPARKKMDTESSWEERASKFTSSLQWRERAGYATPIRLVGQSEWLLLTLAHANPRFSSGFNAGSRSDESPSDVQVLWSLSAPATLTIPTSEDQGRWTTKTIALPSGRSLLRTLVSDNNSTNNPTNMSARIVDVDALQFRYLYGNEWRSTWNSSEQKRLPLAVEVSLVITGWPETHRWLIYMPTASNTEVQR
ncbi:MAG: prepilin-type N-terminal cleavage/methylation domain-containing protein [Pirellulaceae bacterium]|nr:prepilin-type N-terminal cleavage/methylation domain-containing protein [Pirellulaceae bacterium]